MFMDAWRKEEQASGTRQEKKYAWRLRRNAAVAPGVAAG